MMSDATTIGNSLSFDSLKRQIDHLQRERATLEEDIVQLKAAVDIWVEVYRQTRSMAVSRSVRGELR